jgi:hypothetical protein
MMPLVGEFFRYLLSNKECISTSPKKQLFIDLADPAKRSKKDLAHCLKTLTKLSEFLDITLGLNKAESLQVASTLGFSSTSMLDAAQHIATQLNLPTVVIHSSSEVAISSKPLPFLSANSPFAQLAQETRLMQDIFLVSSKMNLSYGGCKRQLQQAMSGFEQGFIQLKNQRRLL